MKRKKTMIKMNKILLMIKLKKKNKLTEKYL
jgi:hypothetical protein